jgi:Holliday junction DNA helicase RuvB
MNLEWDEENEDSTQLTGSEKKSRRRKNSHAVFENPPETVVVSRMAQEPDTGMESLRPQKWDEYPGQDNVVKRLKVYTKAAKMRGQMLDHCLFYGPPGLGKTTLAGIIAHAMGCEMKVTSGPVIERAADIMGLLAGIEANTFLFIDEIHRLPSNVEEVLYSAMEDRRIDILIGQGPSARTVKLDLPAFTLVGATTRPGALSAPLRHRFGISEHLDYYTPESLKVILRRSGRILQTEIEDNAALALAQRSRGTPRIANQLLRRVSDFALVAGKPKVDLDMVDSALTQLGIDSVGLARMDREILRIMRDRHDGGPVGLEAVAAALNEDRSTLEDVYEPFLVYRGFVVRSPRGRMLSNAGSSHLSHCEKKFGANF